MHLVGVYPNYKNKFGFSILNLYKELLTRTLLAAF